LDPPRSLTLLSLTLVLVGAEHVLCDGHFIEWQAGFVQRTFRIIAV